MDFNLGTTPSPSVSTSVALIQVGTITAARTVTLPSASSVPSGAEIMVNAGAGCSTTNTVTIQRGGSDTINGATASVSIGTPFGMRRFISDGTSAWTYDDGLMRRSQNLSDLNNTSTARTNLGLGGAAVLNVGTTAGTVAAGDDSRFTPAYPQVTTYTSGSGNWTNPSPSVARRVHVLQIGGGGGGGSGGCNTGSNACSGGGAASGGAVIEYFTRTDLLASSVSYSVGAKGTGGNSPTAGAANNGNSGLAGNATVFGSVSAAGGLAGGGGPSSGASGGAAGSNVNGLSLRGSLGGANGGVGGFSGTNPTGPATTSALPGSGGGGGGTNGTAAQNGSGSGNVMSSVTGSSISGANGGTSGGAGSNGTTFSALSIGTGGGGGASVLSGAAGAGGNGGLGAGGGGGGAATGGGTAGKGGDGGDGILVITVL